MFQQKMESEQECRGAGSGSAPTPAHPFHTRPVLSPRAWGKSLSMGLQPERMGNPCLLPKALLPLPCQPAPTQDEAAERLRRPEQDVGRTVLRLTQEGERVGSHPVH
jgi:hypothetical protein